MGEIRINRNSSVRNSYNLTANSCRLSLPRRILVFVFIFRNLRIENVLVVRQVPPSASQQTRLPPGSSQTPGSPCVGRRLPTLAHLWSVWGRKEDQGMRHPPGALRCWRRTSPHRAPAVRGALGQQEDRDSD